MATATVVRTAQYSEPTAIPRSVTEALKQGWHIITDRSKSARGVRCGSLTLAKNERRVSVFYFANKDGYRFGSIKVLA